MNGCGVPYLNQSFPNHQSVWQSGRRKEPKFGFGSGSDRSGRKFHTSNTDYTDSNICIKDVCRSSADLEDENVLNFSVKKLMLT
jgi:hypothetical protein